MDWLRISLLILGVILVAGIWVAHRMRTQGRRDGREPDFDDWGDDTAVHIRAHRDDPDFEPVLGESVTDLEKLLDPEDRPLRATPQPSRGAAKAVQDVETPVRPATPPPPPEPVASIRPEPRVKPETEREPEPEREPQPRTPEPQIVDRARAKVASVIDGLKQRVAAARTQVSAKKAAPAAEPHPPTGRSVPEERFDDVSEPRVVGRNPRARGPNREKILVLHVVAPRNRPFTGVALGAALRRAGLGLGEMSIYHYREEGDPPDGDPLFSAANMVAPGTLSDDDLADMMTPGVTLFLQLHACERPQRGFEVLLETAHVLARDLGGRVLDAQQSTATNQTLAHMREDMNQWLLRHRPELLRRKAGV